MSEKKTEVLTERTAKKYKLIKLIGILAFVGGFWLLPLGGMLDSDALLLVGLVVSAIGLVVGGIGGILAWWHHG